MPFTPGTRLGPYEILSPVGSGGMGEVWKARDTRLNRVVAIKTVRGPFSERFEREARAISSLNHPHICTLHDIGKYEGAGYLVMEYVDGVPLSGPLPLGQALTYAAQVSDALDAAHRQGIVHRDLKPANILVTKAGVKLLDFGLAKQRAGTAGRAGQAGGADIDADVTKLVTAEHTILGTPQYMAPEQIEGKDADARTDLFAFGCVLYEMLTGQKAFDGKTPSSIMAAILATEPPAIKQLQPLTPAAVERVVKRCLAKDPEDRWQSARDLRAEIEWIGAGGEGTGHTIARPVARASGLPWAAAVAFAVVVVVAGIALWFLSPTRRPVAAAVTHLQMGLQPAEQFGRSRAQALRPSRIAMAISPDGRLVVFSGARGAATQLYARKIDQAEATPIPGTEGGIGPFFSPDGAWVGFWAGNKLRKVPALGGPPATICDVTSAGGLLGASWAEDGTIFFASVDAGISKVPAAGGTATSVTTPDSAKGERHFLPHTLPGGKAVMFTAQTNDWEKANVVLQSLDTGDRRVLIEGAADARYVETGHLLYMRMGTLTAVPFDVQSLQVTGPAIALIEGVMQAVSATSNTDETGAGQFAVSRSGTLLYVVGDVGSREEKSLVWADRNGKTQPLSAEPPRAYAAPRLSPDGQKVAVFYSAGTNRNADVWVYDVVRGAPTRLTVRGLNVYPIWSPDSTRLVYASNADGVLNLYLIKADGSGTPERLAMSEYQQRPSSWSGASGVIAFVETRPSNEQIWTVPLDGDRKPRLFVESRFNLRYPDFSPDGRWLAYASDESGTEEVYVQPYPGPGEKHRISTDGGRAPVWAAQGRELLYRAGDSSRRFFSAPILSLAPFRAGTPGLLFEATVGEFGNTNPVRGWDVAPGGRLLLTRTNASTDTPVAEMNVVLNWFEELKAKLPAGK